MYNTTGKMYSAEDIINNSDADPLCRSLAAAAIEGMAAMTADMFEGRLDGSDLPTEADVRGKAEDYVIDMMKELTDEVIRLIRIEKFRLELELNTKVKFTAA